MPTELEELVEFLHHGNSQIRQITCQNLAGYSTSHFDIFKRQQLLPVRDLKLLVKDYPQISKHAITILINLSHDDEILKELATDDAFLETILRKITNRKDPDSSDLSTLLANLAKDSSLSRLRALTRPSIPSTVSTSNNALDQLLDLFVKFPTDPGSSKSSSTHPPDIDHLSYLFSDLTTHAPIRQYFLTTQSYDSLIPLSKLTAFTTYPSHIRRAGVASVLKNISFETSHHPILLAPDPSGLDILPYILLPLSSGADEYTDTEQASMPTDLQLLAPDKTRESDPEIMATHVETLLLLTTTREGRDLMRSVNVYPVIRECHLRVENEKVRELCERLVNVIMRDEPEEPRVVEVKDGEEQEREENDEDEKIVEVF